MASQPLLISRVIYERGFAENCAFVSQTFKHFKISFSPPVRVDRSLNDHMKHNCMVDVADLVKLRGVQAINAEDKSWR